MTNTTPNKTENNDAGFGRINLKAETHVVAPGEHAATIGDVRLTMNRENDCIWLFITMDLHDEHGEVLGQVEDKFLTIAAKPESAHAGRVREGLKKLALYANATGVDLNDVEPADIPGHLVGKRLRAVISRRGMGVQAENGIVMLKKAA